MENTLKDALKRDRARVQMGKLSKFGLLELSRQRLQPALAESSHIACPRCAGTGVIRSIESTALHVLRLIQDAAMKENTGEVHAQVPVDVATFLLNEKRAELFGMEERLDVSVFLIPNPHLENPHYEISRIRVDDLDDNAAPSYKRVTQPESSETVPFANKKGEKAMHPEPAVKGVHHASPPPVVASSSQSWWESFKGWLKKLFGSDAGEPAAPAKKSSSRNERSGGTSNKRSNRRNKRRESSEEKSANGNANNNGNSSNGNNGERKNSRGRNANTAANEENAEAKALMQPENATAKAEKEPRNSRNKGELRNRNRNQQNAEKAVDAVDENSVASVTEAQGQPEKESGKKSSRNRKQKPVVVRLGDDGRSESPDNARENKRRRRPQKQNDGEAVRVTVAPAPDSVAALAERVRDAVAHVLAIEAGKVPPSRLAADEAGSLKTENSNEAAMTTEDAVVRQASAYVEQAQITVLHGSLKTADEAAEAVENAAIARIATQVVAAANVASEAQTVSPAAQPASPFNLAEIVAASGLQFVETDTAALAAEAERGQPAPAPRLRRSDVPRVETAVLAVEMVQVETAK